jgi:hypothetical protein
MQIRLRVVLSRPVMAEITHVPVRRTHRHRWGRSRCRGLPRHTTLPMEYVRDVGPPFPGGLRPADPRQKEG